MYPPALVSPAAAADEKENALHAVTINPTYVYIIDLSRSTLPINAGLIFFLWFFYFMLLFSVLEPRESTATTDAGVTATATAVNPAKYRVRPPSVVTSHAQHSAAGAAGGHGDSGIAYDSPLTSASGLRRSNNNIKITNENGHSIPSAPSSQSRSYSSAHGHRSSSARPPLPPPVLGPSDSGASDINVTEGLTTASDSADPANTASGGVPTAVRQPSLLQSRLSSIGLGLGFGGGGAGAYSALPNTASGESDVPSTYAGTYTGNGGTYTGISRHTLEGSDGGAAIDSHSYQAQSQLPPMPALQQQPQLQQQQQQQQRQRLAPPLPPRRHRPEPSPAVFAVGVEDSSGSGVRRRASAAAAGAAAEPWRRWCWRLSPCQNTTTARILALSALLVIVLLAIFLFVTLGTSNSSGSGGISSGTGLPVGSGSGAAGTEADLLSSSSDGAASRVGAISSDFLSFPGGA